MMAKHKVHFFGIETLQRDIVSTPNIFETVCQEILNLPINEKSLEVSDNVSYRLNYFVKVGDHYRGKIVKYRTDYMTTGTLSDDELTDFTLDEGKKFTEVSHFIYSPSTRILSFEYNHLGPRETMFMRYLNTMQMKYRTDTFQFVADLLMHPDAVQQLQDAKKIKSITVGLPVSKIPNDVENNNLLKGLKAASEFGNSGQVYLTIAGARSRSDRTPLISTDGLMTSIGSGLVDLDLFGKVDVAIATDFGADVVNLLENRLEAFKEWNVPITTENTERWYGDIMDLYQNNRELLITAQGKYAEVE